MGLPLQSENVDQIAGALVAAQAEMQNVERNADNTFLGTRYANLAATRDACIGPLNRHGIAVTQTIVREDREPAVFFETVAFRKGRDGKSEPFKVPTQLLGHLRTQLTHSSGQWIASEVPLVAPWGDLQKLGGTISYLRRYALAAIVGLATEDDDGNGANHHDRGQRQQPARQEPRRERPSREAAPEPERGEAFDEFDDDSPAADRGGERVANRERAKESYRRDHPAPAQTQRGPAQHEPPQEHGWPPRSGKGLFAAVADHPDDYAWFMAYGAEMRFPERFAQWAPQQVDRACAAYDLEGERARSDQKARNGHAAAARN